MQQDTNYHQLARADISQLAQIDRTEIINGIYTWRDGALVLADEQYPVPDWSIAEKQHRIQNLETLFDTGASFFGAFNQDVLVGLSVLDHRPIKTGNKRLNLEGLWVSHTFRGKGVGHKLFHLAAEAALEHGASAMYVSATPSKHTVDFYMRLGCQPAQPIDPDLLTKEPEDIHLELVLTRF